MCYRDSFLLGSGGCLICLTFLSGAYLSFLSRVGGAPLGVVYLSGIATPNQFRHRVHELVRGILNRNFLNGGLFIRNSRFRLLLKAKFLLNRLLRLSRLFKRSTEISLGNEYLRGIPPSVYHSTVLHVKMLVVQDAFCTCVVDSFHRYFKRARDFFDYSTLRPLRLVKVVANGYTSSESVKVLTWSVEGDISGYSTFRVVLCKPCQVQPLL